MAAIAADDKAADEDDESNESIEIPTSPSCPK